MVRMTDDHDYLLKTAKPNAGPHNTKSAIKLTSIQLCPKTGEQKYSHQLILSSCSYAAILMGRADHDHILDLSCKSIQQIHMPSCW